jgi:DNA-binding XRE family transcriptional regulator
MSARPPKTVFTEKTFEKAFSSDLKKASAFVWIESAYISVAGVERFQDVLADLSERGVRICTFIQEPMDWADRNCKSLAPARRAAHQSIEAAIELLQSTGAHVNLRPRTHMKLAVIDYKVSWGGTLNILSYTQRTDEEIWRWTDEDWARDAVKRRGYKTLCHICAQTDQRPPAWLSLDAIEIGSQIAELRRQAGMSQDQLAEATGSCRTVISRLELGYSYPRLDLFIRIYTVFQKIYLPVPSRRVEIFDHLASSNK